MTIEELFDEWERDSKIDKSELGEESIKIPLLVAKYGAELTRSKFRIAKLYGDLKIMKREKGEFYFNPTKEHRDRGWVSPPQGRLIKTDLREYVDSDKDVIDIELKIGALNAKIDALNIILKELHSRGFNIKNCIEDRKFLNGG